MTVKHSRSAIRAAASRRVKKVCSVCERLKPLSEFHVNSDARDGRMSMCKPCRNERKRAIYAGESVPPVYDHRDPREVPKLKEIRTKELGMSQRDLAFMVGCSKSTIHRVEHGENLMGKPFLVELIAFVSNKRRNREGRE